MEKVDLLVHIQKIQLELNQVKKIQINVEDDKKNIELIEQLQNDLELKEKECSSWITKIEQADDLTDDLFAKDNTIEELKSNLNFETMKRKQMESMFQDITDREKIIRQELENANAHKVMTKKFCQLLFRLGGHPYTPWFLEGVDQMTMFDHDGGRGKI